MTELPIKAGSANYPVRIGRNLLRSLGTDLRTLATRVSNVFIITSPEIDAFHGEALRAGLREAGLSVTTLFVPAGEQHKRLTTLDRLCEELASAGADRDTLLLALGGGVIGDITGFLAAVYMRGIRFIGIPTTLLAQVDSSVGGKTGVNLRAGKNLVGAFHHPVAVIADVDTLRTLPPRELQSGLQESVKSGIIRDPKLFRYMEDNAPHILAGDADALATVIEASVRMKAAVVGEDERENGVRMTLNFGHTLGHAIESATDYKGMLHGEAVGWGMIAAVHLALRRNAIDADAATRIMALVHRYADLPTFTATAADLVARTARDKKARSGTLSFVLPTGIGQVEIVRDVTTAELTAAAEAMLAEAAQVPVSA